MLCNSVSPRLPRLAPAALAAPLVLLASCAVGPDYQPPPTTMPAAWANAAPISATQPSITTPSSADLAQWWKVFGDAQLDSLIQRAVAANLDVKLAEARIRQARAQRGIVASAFWPSASANASVTRSRTPGVPVSSISNSYVAGFDATWELDVFGGVRRNIESAQASIAAAVEDRRNVLVTLLGDVAADYVQLRGFQRQLGVAQANLKLQEHSLEITRKRLVMGQSASLDIANAQAQVATTASSIPVLETQVRQTIHALSVLLAEEPTALTRELLPPGPIPVAPAQVPVGQPYDLLRRRPDIREAERNLAAATAQIGVAVADLYPQFSLTGSLGLQNEKFRPLWNLSSNFWSIGPSVSWPIFDAGKVRANIAVQAALQDQSLIVYQQTVLAALQDVENALVAYNQEQQHRQFLQEAVVGNRNAVAISTRLYTQGLTDFLNVLTAQLALVSTESQLAQSEAAVSTDLVALYKALGGGWEIGEAAPAAAPK